MMNRIHYSKCPVCGTGEFQDVFEVKDYTVSNEYFKIQECKNCSLRITQDVPDQESIGAYYKSEDYVSHSNTGKGFINRLYQKVRKRTLVQKAEIAEKFAALKQGSLLDIGCGIGSFLHTMQQRGWEGTGLEPDSDARGMAKKLYGLEVLPSENLYLLPQKDFDAITGWHVLEHVHDLNGYMQRLREILKDEGKLFIAVPNYTSKDAKAYNAFWAAYDVPRHLYHFSPQSMKGLLHLHSFRLVKMLPMWYDSFYVSMLSSKYKSGKTNFISSGLHGFSSNINAFGNVEECSSIIYVVEKN
ncbi:MAG TPA: class I SAM-dependent methyltransferase [Niabella sp.]|nr:class I SAM-dependent methyltransferase [Niabella sp.]